MAAGVELLGGAGSVKSIFDELAPPRDIGFFGSSGDTQQDVRRKFGRLCAGTIRQVGEHLLVRGGGSCHR